MRILSNVSRAEDWFDPDMLYAVKKLLPKNAKLYYISPDNFLSLAKATKNPQGSKEKRENLKELIKNKVKLSHVPYLRLKYSIEVDKDLNKTVNKKVAKVYGHEGRHRNLTLKALGFDKTPVVVIFQEMSDIPDYVINQDGDKKLRFKDVFKPYE